METTIDSAILLLEDSSKSRNICGDKLIVSILLLVSFDDFLEAFQDMRLIMEQRNQPIKKKKKEHQNIFDQAASCHWLIVRHEGW